MENKKDIGKAFREKLKDLDQTPDDKVWNAIYADLQKKKKKRFIFPFWMKTVGFLLLATGIMVAIYPDTITGIRGNLAFPERKDGKKIMLNNDGNDAKPIGKPSIKPIGATGNENSKNIENTNKNQHSDSEQIQRINHLNLKTKQTQNASVRNAKNNGLSNVSDKNKIGNQNKKTFGKNKKLAKNRKKKTSAHGKNKTENTIEDEWLLSQKPDSKAQAEKQNLNDTIVESGIALTEKAAEEVANPKKNDSLKTPVKKLPKELPKDSVATKESQLEKIKIFVYGSPTYGKYLSDRSPIDKTLDHNSKNAKISLSYGAYAIYEATPKWSLRFGISIENLQFVTKEANPNSLNFNNINYTNNLSNTDVYEKSGQSRSMDIIQKISYTEIPLEFKYTIGDRKFGISAFGGLSYRFLGKNEVSFTAANGAKFDIGETKHLSSNAFSINAGIGLDYKFSEFVRINLEPVFKFHLFDYKHNQVNPYTIGILAGLQFSLKK